MKCQECDQPATLHITEARDMAVVGERHLCEAHAQHYLQEPPVSPEPAAGIAAGPTGEVRIDLVRIVFSEVHDQQLMVLREAAGRRSFPVVIGIFEATSLNRQLRRLPSPRPLTHDAWAATIGALGGQVQDVLIHDLKHNTYYVWVRIVQGGRIVPVDVRPSDGLVLALTLRVPVLVPGRLLDELC